MVFSETTLKDRVAIVTGGGRGIGRGIAIEFAKVGAHLVLAGRTPEKLEEVAGAIRSLGRRALPIVTDIRYSEQVDEMVKRAQEEFGRIDILVNNAAGFSKSKAEELSNDDWYDLINTNLSGTFFCSRAVGKVMIPQRKGKILNIISWTPFTGAPGLVHSSAGKAGVWTMTKTLSLEWAKYNITVNAIAPGLVETEIVRDVIASDAEGYEQLVGAVPLKRMAKVEEIAYAAIFLASDAADYITGETLVVDGGTSNSGWGHVFKDI